MNDFKIRLEKISKEYEGIKVLDNVDFELKPGKVHVLLGSNGAGKSTLAEIIAGAVQPTSGDIFINDERIALTSVADAKLRGIELCGRENMNFPNLSVAENMVMVKAPRHKWGLIYNSSEAEEIAAKKLKLLDINIEPTRKMSMLSLAEKYLVQFATVAEECLNVLIMDEVTDSLTSAETEKVFETIRNIKKKGTAILFITHKIEESLQIADEISIMRDGKMVKEHDAYIPEREALRCAMLGEEHKNRFPKMNAVKREVVLEARDVTSDHIKGVSFELHKGEIIGIAGLVGSGRTSLLRTILGYDKLVSGDIIVKGVSRQKNKRKRPKVGYLPENRDSEGVFPQLDVIRNISINSLERICSAGVINTDKERYEALNLVDKLDIKSTDSEVSAKTLSSGNKQKMLLARAMMAKMNIYIFDEPTKGVDIAGKLEIYNLMNNLAKKGAAIMLVSSDYNELSGMCDKVLVIKKGELVSILNRDEVGAAVISSLCVE